MSYHSENLARLYSRGRTFARRLVALEDKGVPRKDAARQMAAAHRCSAIEVRRALSFAAAVDRIAGYCGKKTAKMLLSDEAELNAKKVMIIARKHPDRIRHEVAQVRTGRPLFVRPPAGTDPPFDTLHYGKVTSRFARMAGLLDYVGRSDPGTLAALDPGAVGRLCAEIQKHCAAVATRVGGTLPGGVVAASKKTSRPADLARAWISVTAAAGQAAKNARDIARLVAEQPPTQANAAAVTSAAKRMSSAAERLAAVWCEPPNIPARSHRPNTPGRSPGTYVVVYHLPTPLHAHIVGKLGTFDFPPGYYAYVGSAFGGGGVAARVARHLDPHTVKRWNVDYLKDVATPMEFWWTHDPVKQECAWSAVLAAMPGITVPAPAFGSNDCTKCQAHLYRADHCPRFDQFAEAVARSGTKSEVFRKVIVERDVRCAG